MAKESLKQKIFIAKESPFSAEQKGEIRFCIGHFTYKIRGIKCMHVQKPLYWPFVNNMLIISLKGLKQHSTIVNN